MSEYQRPGRILLVEDEVQSRNLMSSYFKIKGFEVTEADNAEFAVPHVPNADLIITDIDQPASKGGYWLLKYVQENHKSIPVILMSGRGVEQEKARGAASFYQKPLGKLELEEMLMSMPEHLTPPQTPPQPLNPPQTPPSA